MMKHLIIFLIALMLAMAAWSQDSEEPTETEADETEVAEQEDDENLDDQGYEQEDDDDFVPSQEVTADQALPFPVDI